MPGLFVPPRTSRFRSISRPTPASIYFCTHSRTQYSHGPAWGWRLGQSSIKLFFYAQMRPRRNPCPCGYFGDLKRECRCGPVQVQRYRQRISGPLLDRIDLHIEVPAVEYRDISSTRTEEASTAIRERVQRAREKQHARFRSDAKVNCNARMGPRQIKQHCKLSDESQELIRVAMTELNLSARAYDRILKVSRTIADLAASDASTPEHVSEAIQYRTFDRTLWV